MKKRIEDLRVLVNKRLNEEFFVLTLGSDQTLPVIFPGQFAQVRVDDSPATFLRRPISVYNVDYQKNSLDLLIKIAGDGTRRLSQLKTGDGINLIYPLGNHFTEPAGKNVLLVGGGTGVAPMFLLGKYMKQEWNIDPVFLLGYRSKSLIIEKQRFESLGKIHITTEDGSFGTRGLVIQHPMLADDKVSYDMIYTCGPELMMRAIAKRAALLGTPCEISLENLMGCGIGACLCCVVDTKDKGYVNSCTEGPIFNTNILTWQI